MCDLSMICNIIAVLGAMVALYWAIKIYLIAKLAGKLLMVFCLGYGLVFRLIQCFIPGVEDSIISDAMSIFWIILALAQYNLYKVLKRFCGDKDNSV